MHQIKTASTRFIGLLTLTLALPGVALAYGEADAIRDCENRIRSEYSVSDLRDATAERMDDVALHFKVQGLAKVDGEKHPWTCEVKNRHVTSAEAEFEKRGYTFISSSQGGDSAYSTWRKGSHCVTARTVNGHYKSIVDVTMADCE